MALKVLKCPNCDANIQLDDDRDYGFCSYCGAQIQVKEIVEVRYTGEVQLKEDDGFEKQMEDGIAFIKMKDYHKAEQVFYRVINKHPGRAEGYEMLICTITRNHTLYIKENYDRVMKMAEKMVAVSSDERKNYYNNLYYKIIENFDRGMQEQSRQEALLKIGRLNKQMKENIIIFILSLVAFGVCYFFGKDSVYFPILSVLTCVIAGVAAIMVIGCKLRKNALLRKGTK